MADRLENDSDESSLLDGSTTEFDGDSSYESASEVSSQVAVDAGLPMSPDQAAAIIQG